MGKQKYTHKKCPHNKRKERCKECNGGAICEHGKMRSRCFPCGGGEMCNHGKRRSQCRTCGGNEICHHDKRRVHCVECNGSSLCEHNRIRNQCKDCNGCKICFHNKRRDYCKECNGSCVCEHGKFKSRCRICHGNGICIHDVFKYQCRICDGRLLCKTEHCPTVRNIKYNGYCTPCYVNNPENIETPIVHNYKTKEKEVVNQIKSKYPDFSWVHDRIIQDGCSRRRPDLLNDFGSHIIIIEIDENKHDQYDCSCENKRLMQISQDLQHRPIVFIRFNPDGYIDQNGTKIPSCWKLNKLGIMQIIKTKQQEWDARIQCLLDQIQYWMDHPTEKTVEIIELYYG
jgi:hypothetical protein